MDEKEERAIIDLRHVGHAVAEFPYSTTHWLTTFRTRPREYRPGWSDCVQVSSLRRPA